MKHALDRREFLRLAAFGGMAYASGLGAAGYGPGAAAASGAQAEDFYFVQLSDTHWGFEGAPNPDSRGTLPKAIAAVNALSPPPDFIVFTGDLTHLTLDGKVRRERMQQFHDIVARLNVRNVRFLAGEHDASVDHGQAFHEMFGASYYTFNHKGVHFIALDNVSDPSGALGDGQLDWLADDLAKLRRDQPIVILTHRPLFDLYPAWGWATRDGARAIAMLMPFQNVTVFYGHIHQLNEHMTGHIAHHAAKSLIFPLPPPGEDDHQPLPWDASQPYRGLGWREVEAEPQQAAYDVQERPVLGS
ncbi:MAG: metallophosphoesterase [Rhodocyclaceae bacterium]|nr:metallophosphoesterase [Rhodocyclaceae bacterium]